jgi:two-component sensor histidine kinase
MSTPQGLPIEAASTLAVVASSHEPLLFLDGDLRVIAASRSFCRAFGIDPASIVGVSLPDLGQGEWASPQLSVLLSAIASGATPIDAYQMDLLRSGNERRTLLCNARRLDDGNLGPVRLLLAITDVTEARATLKLKDDLIREKAILLQEVQHRVANSLQIIASVLMQSARKVQSEEARGHLQDAHHRVMSIAAVQRQLSESTLGDVQLKPYLVQLCQSLAASMIPDPARLGIDVSVDDSLAPASVSVSLGLIVTELVLNALKHAFPDKRKGTIAVDYHASGRNWAMSVSDDGIGMPEGELAPKPGLGTGIVDALANQLEASVQVDTDRPGTTVRIVHDARALPSDTPAAA